MSSELNHPRILVLRTDPDSWKTEPFESAPAVPTNSGLSDVPVRELESKYGVIIQVLDGDQELLRPHSLLHVSGSGLAVQQFFNDLTAIAH